MTKLLIEAHRREIDMVEDKLLELDSKVEIQNAGADNMSGAVEIIAVVASLSTVAANSFLIWAEIEKKKGKQLKAQEVQEESE